MQITTYHGEIIKLLELEIADMVVKSNDFYAANDNRMGNIYCDGAARLKGDLARLKVFESYFNAAVK